MSKHKTLTVQGTPISVEIDTKGGYINVTDMLQVKKEGGVLISKWLSNKDTIEFLGAWEALNNPDFNYTEFGIIRNEAGNNRFVLSVKTWVEKTNAKGIRATAGKYGGTYAHEEIAMELGSWISPVFKLYLLKEFNRLKAIESNQYNLEWNVKRILSKVNYVLHTDAIKDNIILKLNIDKAYAGIEYAKEADLLNVALFGCTAQSWELSNPKLKLEGRNMRDNASINELAVLSNLESLNSIMIKDGLSKKDRFLKLKDIAASQLKALGNQDFIKSLKHNSDTTYPDALALAPKKGDEKKSEFDTQLKGLLAVPPLKKGKK